LTTCFRDFDSSFGERNKMIYAEVVTRVASSLEAGGLPGYPEGLFVEINMVKS
jgi:hypothetical protein